MSVLVLKIGMSGAQTVKRCLGELCIAGTELSPRQPPDHP
jgi:hypothetical protein